VIDSLLSDTISRSHLTVDWANLPLVFLHNPVATFVFDEATWLIAAANPSACRLYGYTSSEFLGMSLLDVVKRPATPQFGPSEFEIKAMFLSRSEPWAHKSKDGRDLLVETTAHGVIWKNKSAFILFANDKTQSMLAQQQLLDALNRMEGALQSKTQFLSTISHEIRTPLNGVIGVTAMLDETQLDLEQRDFVNTIKTSGDQLLSIIDDILDFTRAEQNKLVLETRDFDLLQFMDDVVEAVELLAHQKGLAVMTSIAPDVPAALIGDSARLKQILMNLLTNAVKFTERGAVRISVRVAEMAARPKLLFEIRDTGIGITAEKNVDLFEGFGQVDSSLTRRFGGTGLGLAISKYLVNKMGGEIGVASEPGQGSKFWFTAQFLPGSRQSSAQHVPDLLKGAEVLVVQQSAKERAATRALLEEMGMLVSEAANAGEALSLCAALEERRCPREYSFCLVDSNLPGVDGLEFVRRLRKQPSGEKVHVVLISAHESAEQSSEGGRIGISSFVVKPLRKKQLAVAFSQAASDPEAADSAAGRAAPRGQCGGPASILLVEDNVVNQKVASHSLLKLGYAVEVAANGLQAVDAFEQRQFDLILMDCHMPVMDGYTATQRIRTSGMQGRAVPIIAMTADMVEMQRERCIAAGMNDFLSKPVKREVLSHMLEHWLARA
jgi:two-component system sensor histidine kinase/response regulator